MEVILSHAGSDFDGLAAMVAAHKLYPQAVPVFLTPPEHAVQEFLSLYKDVFPIAAADEVDPEKIRRLILVDTSVPSRLGPYRDLVGNPGIEVHIYDHHAPTAETIQGDLHVVEEVGATTTLLVRRIRDKAIPITPMEATLFCLAIHEETGSLTFRTATPADAECVAWLMARGASQTVVADFLHQPLTPPQQDLLRQFMATVRVQPIHGMQILTATAACPEYVDEMAMVTHRLVDLHQPDAAFCLASMGSRLYIVGRSRRGGLDVAATLGRFGGGGHPAAASATVKSRDLAGVTAELMGILEATVPDAVTAGEIMSSPVQTVALEEASTMAEAQAALTRYGHSAMVVTEGGRPIGMVSRRDTDKALHHGYGTALLRTYMSTPVVTIPADTPLSEIEHLMMERDIGRLPVVDGGALAGIVTRADVLRSLHGSQALLHRASDHTALHRLESVPERVQRLLAACGEVGDARKAPVYLVGGFVRDLLLGVENLDLDLVVEGEGIPYGRDLAALLSAALRVHEKFGTAALACPDGQTIDVASSRTEFYTRPAALPQVKESSLKQDLYRRDFTINAMAICLNRDRYGELVDFFGGQRDLHRQVIRVLHPMSFVEDPTRIFRAIRFEQRYGFRMDQQTERLLADAVASRVLHQVSAKRLRDEIVLMLSEAKPAPAVDRMHHLHVLRLIHPALAVATTARDILERVPATLLQYEALVREEGLEPWLVYFLTLVSQLTQAQVEEVAARLKVKVRHAKILLADRAQVPAVARALAAADISSSRIAALLSPLSLEVILYLQARAKSLVVKQRIAQYLTRLRKVTPLISGADLAALGCPPGPLYKEALAAAWAAQLDGRVTTPEEARALAQARLTAGTDV